MRIVTRKKKQKTKVEDAGEGKQMRKQPKEENLWKMIKAQEIMKETVKKVQEVNEMKYIANKMQEIVETSRKWQTQGCHPERR